MTYSFRVENINDISDIPENHLEIVRAALPSNRSNALSREPDGAQAVFVYEIDGEFRAKLFDRIKDTDSYLQATEDNYSNDPRSIEVVYVLKQQQG